MNFSRASSWRPSFIKRILTRSMAPTSLRETINQGHFYELPVPDLLQQIQHAFGWELDRLKSAYSMQEPGSPTITNGQTWGSTKSPSELLYDQKYDEVDRTLVGILALRWIINDEYETFVSGQPDPVKLQRESFDWLRNFFKQGLKSPEDLFALVTAMIINDLGKDPNLEKDYLDKTGVSVEGMNHDMVLYEAAQAGMVRSLDRLEGRYREDVLLGLKLGSELNAGQLAQAENVIGSLENLLEMRGHERAFDLKYMEQLLDVAGAAGHSDPRCAKKMIEPVFQGFKTVYTVALDIISGKCDLRQGYDAVLVGRGEMLQRKGFRTLAVDNEAERALLRLLTMGRTADKEQADLFYNTFQALPKLTRDQLVDGLNVDGYEDGTAIVPYYMPAMLSEGLENTKNLSEEEKQNALGSLMRFLARVLEGTKSQRGKPGIVIEKNLMSFQKTIGSEEFRKDPTILDKEPIPKGEVLRRRRTSNASVTSTFRTGSMKPAEVDGPVQRQDSFPIAEES